MPFVAKEYIIKAGEHHFFAGMNIKAISMHIEGYAPITDHTEIKLCLPMSEFEAAIFSYREGCALVKFLNAAYDEPRFSLKEKPW